MSLENLEPHVLWLQDILDAKFGKGEAVVICPITDAFVAHHGALGGLVRVWGKGSVSTAELIETISALPEVDIAVDKERAVRMFELYPTAKRMWWCSPRSTSASAPAAPNMISRGSRAIACALTEASMKWKFLSF